MSKPMRDPSGRTIVRTKTAMRIALEEASTARPLSRPFAKTIFGSRSGFVKVPAWTVSKREKR